ncbi:MAG: hypothetical protein DHS20C15_20660 [Planctomycetota bacterium]|nr:MAG: hypothetical protein DHS20C15_20660 [Planctomycetota bacterium]
MHSEDQAIAWLGACSVIALAAIWVAVVLIRRRSLGQVALRASALSLIAIWLSPVSQLYLNSRAQSELRDRIAAHTGAQISELKSEFGSGRGCSEHARAFAAVPWYAPFGLSFVQVYVNGGNGIVSVEVDD